MKQLSRFAAVAATAAMTALTLAACSTDDGSPAAVDDDCTPAYEFPTIEEGKLLVSTYDGMPYFTTENGQPTGMDADFLSDFAAASCLEIDFTVTPSAAVIQSVVDGRTDVAAGGWYATPERGELVALSAPIYLEPPTIFSESGTADIQDLVGQSVGTISGYTWVDELRELVGDGMRLYDGAASALADMKAGRIDFALLGGIDAPYLVSQNPEFDGIKSAPMDPDPAITSSVEAFLPNYPHTKGNTELTEALNAAIEEARDNGRWVEILEKYGLDPRLTEVDRFE